MGAQPFPLSSRTRISSHAAPYKATCAPFRKEGRMRCTNATKFHRKSGGAEPRDLRVKGPLLETFFHHLQNCHPDRRDLLLLSDLAKTLEGRRKPDLSHDSLVPLVRMQEVIRRVNLQPCQPGRAFLVRFHEEMERLFFEAQLSI